MQRGLAACETGPPEARRIVFRATYTRATVVVEEHDISDDGV